MNRAANLTIFQYTLGTISEWDNLHSIATDRNTSSQIVHVGIAYIWRYIAMYPGVQNTSSIDAKQNTQTI